MYDRDGDRGGGGYNRRPSGRYERPIRGSGYRENEHREEIREEPEKFEYRKYDTLVTFDYGNGSEPGRAWGNFVDIVDECIVIEGNDQNGDPVEYQIPMRRVIRIRKRIGPPNGTQQPGVGK